MATGVRQVEKFEGLEARTEVEDDRVGDGVYAAEGGEGCC